MTLDNLMTFVLLISGFGIALMVLLGNKKDVVSRWFFVLVNLIVLNILSSHLSNILTDSDLAFVWTRVIWATTSLLLPALYFFAIYFPIKLKSFKILDILFITAGVIFTYMSLFTKLFTTGVLVKRWGTQVIEGPLISLFYLTVIFTVIFGFYLILWKYVKLDHNERRKIKYFLWGIAIFVISNIVFGILLPSVLKISQYTSIGDYSVIVFIIMTAYAIVKQHLFDIRLAIVRSVTYFLVLSSLAGIYVAFTVFLSTAFGFEQYSPSQISRAAAVSLLLLFIFHPLKQFFDKITNRLFYKDRYQTDDFLASLNRALTSTTDLRSLLGTTAGEIGRTLKSEQTSFFIFTQNGHYISAGTPGHKQMPKHDAIQLEAVKTNNYGVIAASLLDLNDPIRRLMVSHRVELILPLNEADKAIGYLCLGSHLTSGYTSRDMKVLSSFSDELTISIQNAMSIQEVKDLNETLQQRINEATRELRASNAQLQRLDKAKDEFVGMASHQLRTPLTSVKGYISMVIEGDAGKITDTQRHLLDEAFTSSERMVRLINDFLNVSRLQTGKFLIDKRPVMLAKVVEQELDSLATTAASRNLAFVYEPPEHFPMLDLDEGKMRQVIMNFADNALYYSAEHTSILVKLVSDEQQVTFTIKDSGIGVPIGEQAQLFSKFYRASNARRQRPDGTGVGLFLAKKVIDAHGGKVIFDSIEGQGSTFGFHLPIDRLRSVDDANQLEN